MTLAREGGRMSQKFRRNPKIESAPLSSDAILLDPDRPQFFLLNETSASFWAYLAVDSTPEELAAQICRDFDGVEPTEAREDAEKILKEMLMQGLVETNDQS